MWTRKITHSLKGRAVDRAAQRFFAVTLRPNERDYRLRAAGLLASLGVASPERLAEAVGLPVEAVRLAVGDFDNEPQQADDGGTALAEDAAPADETPALQRAQNGGYHHAQ